MVSLQLADGSGGPGPAAATPHDSARTGDRQPAQSGDPALRHLVDTYRSLARSMPSGFVVLFDSDLRYEIADGVELAAFGFTRDGLEGRTLQEALSPDIVAELEPNYRSALAGTSVSWERVIGHRTFKLTAGPVVPDEGPIVSGMVTAFDITEERRTERTWGALHAIATDVARRATPDEVAQRIASSLVEIFGADSAAVTRYTSRQTCDVLAVAPVNAMLLGTAVEFAPDDASALSRVASTGEAALVRYPSQGGGIARRMTAEGIRVGAAAPIRFRGVLWGAVTIASADTHGLDERVLGRLAGFAELVELAIGNAQQWDALAREAAVDDLTGLPNRRTFNDHLHREVERARRHDRPVSVAMMDLDRFKGVNDRFGHPVGDRVLTELGRRIIAASRDGELVARLGGEEFGWIMPETDGESAVAAAERLRTAVAEMPFGEVGVLSISVGVCSLADVADQDALMAGADAALYEAKNAGRDRVARHVG